MDIFYCGKPINKLSKKELVEALTNIIISIEKMRGIYQDIIRIAELRKS